MFHDIQSAQISQKQDEHSILYIYIYIYIYAIMKTMCLPSGHNNGFVATLALGYMMYGYTLLVAMN